MSVIILFIHQTRNKCVVPKKLFIQYYGARAHGLNWGDHISSIDQECFHILPKYHPMDEIKKSSMVGIINIRINAWIEMTTLKGAHFLSRTPP